MLGVVSGVGSAVASEALSLTTALTNASAAATTNLGIIEGDELLYTLFAASLIFLGSKIVVSLKRAAKH